MSRVRTFCVLLLLGSDNVVAEEFELPPLEISSIKSSSDWQDAPLAVSSVSTADHPGEQLLTLGSLLSGVPGTLAQSRYNMAQGMRLSVRGFGARSSFGMRGLRVLVDGVPLTMPDGQTEMDGLDLSLVERVEVIRGSASTLYGNGAGGVLSIYTMEPPADAESTVEVSRGSYGFDRTRLVTGGTEGNVGAYLALNVTNLNGYREHSASEARNLTGKVDWEADSGKLSMTFQALDNRSEDPGALTLAEVKSRRDKARTQSILYNSDETITQQRMALIWKSELSETDSYQLRSWLGRREFQNSLPLASNGQTSYSRLFSGVGAQYSHATVWWGLNQELTVGLDVEQQRDDRERHNNTIGGNTGELTLRQREKAGSYSAYAQQTVHLSDRLQATVGTRYDSVRQSVSDRFDTDGDSSDVMSFNNISYSAGLSYRLTSNYTGYVRVATSFETPTLNELSNPSRGGFDTELEPAKALTREIGLKGEWNSLRMEASVYRISLKDELVPFTSNSITRYRNAGSSQRDGFEFQGEYRLLEDWRLSMAYSFNNYHYEDFAAFDNRRLPGVPLQQLFTEIAYDTETYYASLNGSVLSKQYADNANDARVPGVMLLNLRAGARLSFHGQDVEPFLGLDNLLGRDYYDNLRINDAGGRYYEPGPGRTIYAGIKMAL